MEDGLYGTAGARVLSLVAGDFRIVRVVAPILLRLMVGRNARETSRRFVHAINNLAQVSGFFDIYLGFSHVL